ncbi:MAG: hypothetical protein H6Q55_3823 [Deltaproteobacteria bacterium]|jgi:hypothetical protein|nr:hypothetical protein [Deltaproteobacteria bacterium]
MNTQTVQSFDFRACISVLKSTGKKARNLRELRDIISVVSEDCLFHHTYQYFLKGHVLEYTSDFAHWAGESLEERALAERLANIDPYDLGSIDAVRRALVKVIDDYLLHFPEPREALAGDEFYFNETVSLVFPVGVRVKNLAEFLAAIKYVDAASIYYHFFEARMRLGSGKDDFSSWMDETLGKTELALKVRSIDPFMHSLEDIRRHVADAVEKVVRKEMEVFTP